MKDRIFNYAQTEDTNVFYYNRVGDIVEKDGEYYMVGRTGWTLLASMEVAA